MRSAGEALREAFRLDRARQAQEVFYGPGGQAEALRPSPIAGWRLVPRSAP